MRLGVLASGTGSILEAMLAAGLPVSLVVVDRPCRAVELAERAGVEVEVIERRSFGEDFERDRYTDRVVEALCRHEVDLVAMAGFGTILGPRMFTAFPDRVLNTHPSLLPAFPGWHAVDAALDYGVKVTGCTIHLAVPEVDAGPILAQEAVEVRPGDDAEALHERIKAVERRLYPATVRNLIDRLEES